MLGNGLRVMRVCMEEMELGREMWKERFVCAKHMVQKRGEEESDVEAQGEMRQIDFVLVGKSGKSTWKEL